MSQSQPQKITFTPVEKSNYDSTLKTDSRNTYITARREAGEEISPEIENYVQKGPFYFGQTGNGSGTGMYFTLVKSFSRKKFKPNSETVNFQWFLIDQNWYKQVPDRQQLLMIDSKQSKNYLACPIKHIADWVCKFIGNHKNDILEFMKNPDQQKYNYKGEGTNHGGAANLILNNYTSGDGTTTPCIGLVLENSSHRFYADKFNFCAGKYEEKDGYWSESEINGNKQVVGSLVTHRVHSRKRVHKQPVTRSSVVDNLFFKGKGNTFKKHSQTPTSNSQFYQQTPFNNQLTNQLLQDNRWRQQNPRAVQTNHSQLADLRLLNHLIKSQNSHQQSSSSNLNSFFQVGQSVQAQYQNGAWYPATVITNNGNGFYTIKYLHDNSVTTNQHFILMRTIV